jgi:catechol 2,3-dioxygenase-like lactoylglutathione lyase family enzyme
MLANYDVMAHAAVKDLQKAKEFYEGVLGFSNGEDDEVGGGTTYKSGNSRFYIYESQFAGTNQATGASWNVDDIAAVVDELKTKGVVFEQYDIPGTTREGDIHMMGPIKVAWFKDPDGNIFAVEGR